MRLIPARPRLVRFWAPGVTPEQYGAVKSELRPFLEKVAVGQDLTPHLSYAVNTAGIVLPGARSGTPREDIDRVLVRAGLHHFHTGITGPSNPKGRSGRLIFAEVLEQVFQIVAIADHDVFKRGSDKHLRFFELCESYIARDVLPGRAYMANPVMSSGHSMVVTMFGIKCEDEMLRLDRLLDDAGFIDQLYSGQPILRDGKPVSRPANPSLGWHFEDLKFGILDRRTKVFFCLFPFFSR
jgi:hypothetical protein